MLQDDGGQNSYVDGDSLRLSSDQPVSDDLEDVVKICREIVKNSGFKELSKAIESGKSTKSSMYYAALAVLHAEQAKSNIVENVADDAAFNAMRAVQYQNLAIVKQTKFSLDRWQNKRSRSGSLLINKFSKDELLQFRQELVKRLREENVMEAMIPRHCARVEGNYHSAGMAPKYKVDKIKKYLIANKLISIGIS
tara:strand:+ start:35 stop:619 length:585 start_codon:yes stop_codon:yes gene_type:complete